MCLVSSDTKKAAKNIFKRIGASAADASTVIQLSLSNLVWKYVEHGFLDSGVHRNQLGKLPKKVAAKTAKAPKAKWFKSQEKTKRLVDKSHTISSVRI